MLASACGNQTARAPVPTAYDWPDAFAYRIRAVARTERDTEWVARYERSKQVRFLVRGDGAFSVSQDSVRLTDLLRGGRPASPLPLSDDTTRYFVRLSRWGEFLSVEPACDPSMRECRDALPSALLMDLRRIIPRLPVWWPPRGRSWEDTLRIDDSPRPRGLRGTLVTEYRVPWDTVVGGEAYWVVASHSAWRSTGTAAAGVVEENAVVYVDKLRLVPAFAEWSAGLPPPAELMGRGATRTVTRGRAVLVGSPFDSPSFAEEAR